MSTSVARNAFEEVNLISGTLADVGEAWEFGGSGVLEEVTFEIENTGAALTDLALLVQPHPDSDFHVLLSSTQWDTVAGNLLDMSAGLKTLASGAKGFAVVRPGPAYALKWQAAISGGVRNRGILTATQNATNEKATGVLTITVATTENFANGEEHVIGENTYTSVTALTEPAVPYEVLIGATAADSMTNMAAAVNGSAGAGTLYGTGTVASEEVTAVASTDGSDELLTVTAIERGTAGNSIATTTDSAEAVWGGAVLSGGTLETVTCDGEVYTFKHSDNLEDDNDVEIGASKEDTIDNLVVVFNATQTRTQGVRASATMVVDANADISNAVGTLIGTTENAAQWAWGATTLADAVMTTVEIKATAKLEL
jgi:hypothetical protein